MAFRKPLPHADELTACRDALNAPREDAAATLRYDCTLVTPMYGGGVKAGEVDTAMPIRATAIRGQLRHWWRLLNRRDGNGNLRTSKALFEAERALWGGLGDAETLAASKVAVSVAAQGVTQHGLQPVATYSQREGKLRGPEFGNLPGYVLFPGQGKSERGKVAEQPKQLLMAGFKFRLTLHFDRELPAAHREQVREAVRWWATFGGVGARTRRGCGAVEVIDADRKLVRVDESAVQKQGWRLVVGTGGGDAIGAWKQAADALKDFRQKPGFARNPGQGNRPGRSRWPEPDAIRRITGSHAALHEPKSRSGDVFPRAAFGLPIITHFKQEREWRQTDPQDTTLKPIPAGSAKASERMASPLILRPYHDGSSWRPAVLCMGLDHIKNMSLSLEGKFQASPKVIPVGQWQARAMAGEIAPLQGA